jgi:hypothetical protein
VNQTVAFEIGAVFLLVVLFMAGTKMKGVFPQLGRNVQYVLIAIGVLFACFWAYRMWPEAHGELLSILPQSSAPASVTPSIQPHSPPTQSQTPVAKHSSSPARKAGKVSEVELVIKETPHVVEPEVPEAIASVTPQETESAPAKENRGKRIIKSIGRALHIGRKDTNNKQPD